MRWKFVEVLRRGCSDMLTDRQTHRHTDRPANHSTPLSFRGGGVTNDSHCTASLTVGVSAMISLTRTSLNFLARYLWLHGRCWTCKVSFKERLKVVRDGLRRIASGRLFRARGAATAKARSPIVVRRVAGTMRSADDAERRRRRDSALATGQMAFCR